MFLKLLDPLGKKIGFRLTFWFSAFFIIGTLSLFALAYFLLASSLQQYDRDSIQQRLRQLAAKYQVTDLAGLKKELALETRLRKVKPFFMRIAGPRNTTLFVEIPDQWAEFDLSQLEHAPMTDSGALFQLPAQDDNDEILEIAALRLPDGSILQVGKTTEDRDSLLERFGSIVAGIMIPVIVLGVLGGATLAARTLRPIRQLIQTVRAIGSGALESRVPIRRTGDELDELGVLFNGMLDQIAALIQGMRNALDNVAHDLRTPVARLRGSAELALRSEPELTACREALADCVEEADELLRSLNTLMDISEAETGTLKLTLEVVNIAALIEDTVDLYQDVAAEKAITVLTTVPKDLRLTADRNRLRQVLANLLDNALKYTPAGGRVELKAYPQARQVVISVEDSGIGMTPDELTKIWDRLYRGDRSRSQRGLGLGLSLVKAVVEAHQGQVEASSQIGGGSTFKLFFPLASAGGR
jgi:signal transduction histidine kinase